jgi:effector-binding domain-containing protein
MSRWKCIAVIDNQALIFKRYAENEEQVRKELLEFIKERYKTDAEITEVILDKIHPVKQEEQITNDTDKLEERGEGNV